MTPRETASKPRIARRHRNTWCIPTVTHTTTMGRKRPRSYTDDDEQQQFVDPIDESESAQDTRDGSRSRPDANGSGEQEIPDDDSSEERERELDVWESFKEEHHEGAFLQRIPRRRVHHTLLFVSSRTAAVVVASPVQADTRVGRSERGYAPQSPLCWCL